MKYIIYYAAMGEEALLFPNHMNHSDVAQGKKVVSAGFCDTDGESVTCWGKSASLNLGPEEGDDGILTRMFYPKGWLG